MKADLCGMTYSYETAPEREQYEALCQLEAGHDGPHFHWRDEETPTVEAIAVMYGDGGRTTVGDLLRWLSAFEEDTTVVLGEGDVLAPTLRLEDLNNERVVVIRAAA